MKILLIVVGIVVLLGSLFCGLGWFARQIQNPAPTPENDEHRYALGCVAAFFLSVVAIVAGAWMS